MADLKVEHIDILRNITNVGDEVSFNVYGLDKKTGQNFVTNTIKGKVAEKYTHVFLLEDGTEWTWVTYMLGCPFDIRRTVFGMEEIMHGVSL